MFHSREYLTKPDTKHISTEPCGPKKTVTSYLLLWWNSLAWLTITIKYWNEDAWSCMKKERERTNRKSCRRWCLVRHSSRLDSGEIIELRSGTSRTVELTYSWIWAKRIWGNCTCFSFAKKQKQTNKNLLKLGKSKEKKKTGSERSVTPKVSDLASREWLEKIVSHLQLNTNQHFHYTGN